MLAPVFNSTGEPMGGGAGRYRGSQSNIGGSGTTAVGGEVDIGALVSVIAAGFSIDPNAIVAPSRDKAHIALTRQVSMYVAHVALGLTLTEVGRKFGRDRTTAAHACRLIEDLRDNRDFDFALEHLELAAIRLTTREVNR